MGRRGQTCVVIAMLVAPPALAQEPDEDPEEAPAQSFVIEDSATEAPRNFGNFRAGAGSSSESGKPYLCLELAPFSFLAVEGCGTGSGILHDDDSAETAHFRTKLRLANFLWRESFLQPHVALGFAELQVGEDSPGFDFAGTGPDGVETAGPEAGVGIRMLRSLGSGIEFVGDVGVAYAWMPHAPELVEPRSRHQVAATFTLGVGF